MAVLCYDSCISLFQADTATEIGTIETRSDIDAGRETRDKVKKSTSERNKFVVKYCCLSILYILGLSHVSHSLLIAY